MRFCGELLHLSHGSGPDHKTIQDETRLSGIGFYLFGFLASEWITIEAKRAYTFFSQGFLNSLD